MLQVIGYVVFFWLVLLGLYFLWRLSPRLLGLLLAGALLFLLPLGIVFGLVYVGLDDFVPWGLDEVVSGIASVF